jgi:hypothetical protein
MKAEMQRYGIGPEDPKRFSRLIEVLQRGNYDCAKILGYTSMILQPTWTVQNVVKFENSN